VVAQANSISNLIISFGSTPATVSYAGLAVGVIGLYQFVNGQAIITAEGGAERLASVYGSPNNVGLFLGRCIPFLLAFTLIRVDRLRRILAGISLIIVLIAAVLSHGYEDYVENR